jgi:hypothetical protein
MRVDVLGNDTDVDAGGDLPTGGNGPAADTITLKAVQLSSLHASDFAFV